MMDFFLYSSICDYTYARISFLTEHMLSKNLTFALTIIVALLALWIMIQDYLITTSRSQEGLKGFVYGLSKTYLIVAVALGAAAGGGFNVRVLTGTLSDGISQIMAGDSDVGSKCLTQDSRSAIGCRIDQNLTATRSVMGILDGIDTTDSECLEEKAIQARWFVGVGTAGPAVVTGIMLIMLRIAIALFIGFAPIFILCLLFKKTVPLFQKWLYYGLAAIFSSVMLDIVAGISMDLVGNIAITGVVSSIAAALTGGNVGDIIQTVAQQLDLGLILSTLLITVPSMAGAWFNGMMAGFNAYSVIDNRNHQEVPPHLDGGASRRVNYNIPNDSRNSTSLYSDAHYDPSIWAAGGTKPRGTTTDTMKSPSQPGKGDTSI